MSVQEYDSGNKILKLIAGGTLWADTPVGTINAFGGAEAPKGWLLCQGQAVSRTDYADLFDVIGTAFGPGDGSTTFNVPDFTGKTAMGAETNHVLGASENGAVPNLKDSLYMCCADVHTGVLSSAPEGQYKIEHASGTNPNVSIGYFSIDASKGSNLYKDNQTKIDAANVRVNFIIKAVQISLPADLQAAIEDMNLITYGE